MPLTAVRSVLQRGPANGINFQSHQSVGLLAWYPLQGDDGAIRETVGGHFLTKAGTIVSEVDGDMGLTADFDGTSGIYTINQAVFDALTTEATICGWVKLDTASPTYPADAFPFTFAGANLLGHYPYSGDGVCYVTCLIAARQSFSPLAAVDRADWHHVAVSSKPGSGGWNCYTNGLLAATATGDSTFTNWFHLIGGSDAAGSFNFMGGKITDVRVYNRALSEAEVIELVVPQTRWELYRSGRRWSYSEAAAAGGGTLPDGGHDMRAQSQADADGSLLRY